ncbi:PREDICTED: regulator of G-protein signaling 17 isoform X2 [Ceratosolen solmsi marchali]|uniref:Regulator of G-protein signaling 17 isoform X2 n=1 Tax=Ceratosolen solmsi marchali TaxID=326594 RepID=A0AAJ7E005_9HYME|nr:PREDICTED: regulator of G-protein signaling 17 isoform X2 [Ceratosolen solmsi marchali]
MIEMSSGIGATAMGIGVSHGSAGSGGGGGGVSDSSGGGCRLRAQSQSQASTGSSNQQRGSNNSGQPQGQQQQVQQQQRHGVMGRSKKDNCCLCWCCCCSCSCLAAVGTGGSGGAASMRPGAGGGLGAGDHGSSAGLVGELATAGAGNGFDGDIGDIGMEEIRSWSSSFDRLMRNPVGRKLFREFLVSEYSDENIAFWLACEQLKRESNPEKIEEKARFIYEDYISIISPKEVSLDSRVREIVNRNMTRPTPHTFDEAQLQIYTLMHRDSYPRFVNSELYQRVARINSGPPSPCIEPGDGTSVTAVSATSSSQPRKPKKSIT